MAKINQTQRNHMISRLNDAIQEKRPKSINTPNIFKDAPSICCPPRYASSYSKKDVEKLDEAIKWFTKNRAKLIKEFDQFVDKLEKKREKEDQLYSLKNTLLDELMLGNDLQDLTAVLKKVEEA